MKVSWTLALVSSLACTLAHAEGGDSPPAGQQRIASMGYFDVFNCSPEPLALPPRTTKEVMVGALLPARPMVLECLVDPRNRGPAKLTKVVIDTALAESGLQHQVTGDNLTPEGIKCVDGALDAWAKAMPSLNAKLALGTDPLKGHLEVQHLVGVTPAVTFGLNEASDIAGSIRLAEPGWCDCLASWKQSPPRPLKCAVKVAPSASKSDEKGKAQVVPQEVTFEPSGDAVADKVGACLKGKISGLQVKAPAEASLTVPYTFRFVHSGLNELLPGASPDVQFSQLDLERARVSAEVAMAGGYRSIAAHDYDALVKQYKARPSRKPKAPAVKLKDLQASCASLLQTDDRITQVFQKLLGLDQATQKLASELAATQPAWSTAAQASGQRVEAAQKDIQGAQKTRAEDQAICPKEHF